MSSYAGLVTVIDGRAFASRPDESKRDLLNIFLRQITKAAKAIMAAPTTTTTIITVALLDAPLLLGCEGAIVDVVDPVGATEGEVGGLAVVDEKS